MSLPVGQKGPFLMRLFRRPAVTASGGGTVSTAQEAESQMLEIVLIRPGSTDYDEEQRIQGTLDIPLNAAGNTEMKNLAAELHDQKIEAVYAPPCQPAEASAIAIAEHLGVKFRRIDRMHNLDQGLWQGLCVDELKRKHPKVFRQWQQRPETVRPPEGETLTEAGDRIRYAIMKMLKRHKTGRVALIVPEPLAGLIKQIISEGDLSEMWKATKGHGDWEVLQVLPEFADDDTDAA